jgi:hypothetical protein
MLNIVLACVAVLCWGLNYGLFFRHDLRRWWQMRPIRRQQAIAEHERAVRAYAEWVRNMPPPRTRKPIIPSTYPQFPAVPAHTAVIVPFPRAKRTARR